MRILDRRLLRTLRESKTQFLAVVAVLFFGLMAYTSLTNTTQNLDGSLDRYYTDYQFADLFGEFAPFPAHRARSWADLPGIDRAEVRLVTDFRADLPREPYPSLRMVGMPPDAELNRLFIQAGSFNPSPRRREIGLLHSFAQAHDLTVGDTIDLFVRGDRVSFVIIALVDSPEYIYAIQDVRDTLPDEERFGVAFTDLETLQQLTRQPETANRAVFSLTSGAEPRAVHDEVEETLKSQGLQSLVTRADQLSHAIINMELQGLRASSSSVPLAFIVISALIIYLILQRLIQGDRVIIGILKATGFTDGEILLHYIKYALFLGILGSITGMVAGFALANPLSHFYMEFFHIPTLYTELDGTTFVTGLLLTLLLCGGTGYLAARASLRIAPADAMRPLAPPPGQRNLWERIFPQHWRSLSFSWKLALRSLFRNKRRFGLAVLGVALTFAVVVLPFYFLEVLDLIFVEQFEHIERYNHAVTFRTPVGDDILLAVRREADVYRVEPHRDVPLMLQRGWRQNGVILRALDSDTELYRLRRTSGETVQPPERGILLSEYLARELGVTEGDWIRVSSYLFPDDQEVRVAGVVVQYLGSGAYTSHEQLQEWTHAPALFSGVLIDAPGDLRAELSVWPNVQSVYSSQDLQDRFAEYTNIMAISFTAMILIGGLLGFAILFNTVSVAVAERTREFASLRVLGFSKGEIYTLVIRENGLAVIAGLLVGPPLGRGISLFIAESISSELFFLSPLISWPAYIMTGLIVLVFVAIVWLAIWFRIRRIQFLEALSSRMT